MDEIAILGAQKRIDFLERQSLAFFTVIVVLTGWIGARYEAGMFGMVFWTGVVGLAVIIAVWGGLIVAAHIFIKRLEGHKNV